MAEDEIYYEISTKKPQRENLRKLGSSRDHFGFGINPLRRIRSAYHRRFRKLDGTAHSQDQGNQTQKD